jgi:hypothetical protein
MEISLGPPYVEMKVFTLCVCMKAFKVIRAKSCTHRSYPRGLILTFFFWQLGVSKIRDDPKLPDDRG